jgi:hypothetical protein
VFGVDIKRGLGIDPKRNEMKTVELPAEKG